MIDELLAADVVDDGFLITPATGLADVPTHDADLWLEGQVASFRIRRLIASGGMGAVYEAELLARLKHTGIAQVYEAGVLPPRPDDSVGETPWFALELVEGAHPITVHARREKLELRQRIELFLIVCDAVHHGHQRSIVHRDLKPANILVGRNGQPKVIDFGIAKALDRAPGEASDRTFTLPLRWKMYTAQVLPLSAGAPANIVVPLSIATEVNAGAGPLAVRVSSWNHIPERNTKTRIEVGEEFGSATARRGVVPALIARAFPNELDPDASSGTGCQSPGPTR